MFFPFKKCQFFVALLTEVGESPLRYLSMKKKRKKRDIIKMEGNDRVPPSVAASYRHFRIGGLKYPSSVIFRIFFFLFFLLLSDVGLIYTPDYFRCESINNSRGYYDIHLFIFDGPNRRSE